MRHVELAVIGGGITGQLVQIQCPHAEIFDWNPSARGKLTRQFGANYLWEPLPFVPCRQFWVVTHVDGATATLESVLRYKEKIGKQGDVLDWERQFTEQMVGYDYDPADWPETRIQYGYQVVQIELSTQVLRFGKGLPPIHYRQLVSTIPLPALLNMCRLSEPAGRLTSKPIYVQTLRRPPDSPVPAETMYVNYISDPGIVPYRYCDRERERHYESIELYPDNQVRSRRLSPGKIYDNPNVGGTLDFLARHHIFTFGRYGSWRPDELVHETWHRITEWSHNGYVRVA